TMSAINLREPFEIDQKIIAIEKQNNLFDINVSIPVEIGSKIESSKILNKVNVKTIDEKTNDLMNDAESIKSDTEKSINENDSELEEKILVTCKGSGISLVSDDGRQLRNWTIPTQCSVITPAKCIIKSGRCYVYVIIHSDNNVTGSDKVIWFWKDKKKSLESPQSTKKKTREFEKGIFSLELSSLLPKNIILINKDGSLLLVKTNLKPVGDNFIGAKTKKKKNERRVIWSTLFNSSGSCVPTNFLPHPSLVVLTISMNKSEKNSTTFTSKHLFLSFTWINCDKLCCGLLGHYTLSDQVSISSTSISQTTILRSCLTQPQYGYTVSSGVLKIFMITFNFIESNVDITLSEIWKFEFDGLIPFTEKHFSTIQGEHAIGFAPISDSYLALVGMQKTSTSINKVLTIWDLRYGTLQAECVLGTLKQENSTDIASYPSLFKFQLIVVPGSNLIVSTLSESLSNNPNTFKLSTFLCRCHYEPMTLLHALNRMEDSSAYLQLGSGYTRGFGITRFGLDLDTKPKSIEHASDEFLNDIENNIKELQKEEYRFLKFLLFKSHTTENVRERFQLFVKQKGVEAFESFLKRHDIDKEQYKKYLENWKSNKKFSKKSKRMKAINIYEDDNDNPDIKDDDNYQKLQDLWKEWEVKTYESRKYILNQEKIYEYLESGEAQRPELSYYFIQTVIEYCLSKNPDGTPNLNCWVPEVLQYFIQSKMMSNKFVKGGIIKALIERETWDLIKSALYFMNDIPEDDLVYLLKYAISSQTKTFSIGSILRYLIAAPKNDNMMIWSLRQLTEDEVMTVMKILYGWVEKYDQTEFVKEVLSKKQESQLKMHECNNVADNLPEFHKLLEFLTLLLDAHFTTLIMDSKIHPLLSRLANRIACDVLIYESLESTRGCLESYHKYSKRNILKKTENVRRGKSQSYIKDADLPEYSVELFTFDGDYILDSIEDEIQVESDRKARDLAIISHRADKRTTKEIKMKLLASYNERDTLRTRKKVGSWTIVHELVNGILKEKGSILYYQQPDINMPEDCSEHYYQLTLSDNLWLQQARDHGSFCFGIDGKYDLNSDGAPILSLVVKDCAGYGTPIAFGVSNKENSHMIRLAVEAVQRNIPCNDSNCLHQYNYIDILNGKGFMRIRNCAQVWRPYAMIDKHRPTKRGLQPILRGLILCWFHIMQTLGEHLKNLRIDERFRYPIAIAFKAVGRSKTKEEALEL
ncbi:20698_t:CDS:10, partial [Racocetra persica]